MQAQRTALVTGASTGLGLAWVRKLAAQDYHVYLTARNVVKAENAAIEAGFATNQVTALPLDVTNENHMISAAALVQQQFGKLDVLINNAGYYIKDQDSDAYAGTTYLNHLNGQELLKSYHIHSVAPLLMLKHFRALLKAGKDKKALHMGSQLGSVSIKTETGGYAYSGSKQALVMLNKAASLELAQDGIASVVVHPGWVSTRMGGSQAPLTAVESIEQMYTHILEPMHTLENGGFYSYDGSPHAL